MRAIRFKWDLEITRSSVSSRKFASYVITCAVCVSAYQGELSSINSHRSPGNNVAKAIKMLRKGGGHTLWTCYFALPLSFRFRSHLAPHNTSSLRSISHLPISHPLSLSRRWIKVESTHIRSNTRTCCRIYLHHLDLELGEAWRADGSSRCISILHSFSFLHYSDCFLQGKPSSVHILRAKLEAIKMICTCSSVALMKIDHHRVYLRVSLPSVTHPFSNIRARQQILGLF